MTGTGSPEDVEAWKGAASTIPVNCTSVLACNRRLGAASLHGRRGVVSFDNEGLATHAGIQGRFLLVPAGKG